MSTTEASPPLKYKFSARDIDAVNIMNWLPIFKKVCPKTAIVPVTADILKYFKSDYMALPKDTITSAHMIAKEELDDDAESWASFSEDEDKVRDMPENLFQKLNLDSEKDNMETGLERGEGDSSGEDEASCGDMELPEIEKFWEFDRVLEEAIDDLDGAVMPKLNEKAPKDATWISLNRSLKCFTPGDVYLLMKTSDIISSVLNGKYYVDADDIYAQNGGRTQPNYLTLKKWMNIWSQDMEFRCFVYDNELVGICQRDMDTSYSWIINQKDCIISAIDNFFDESIKDQFPLNYYIMDVICQPTGKVYLLDFSVWGPPTDPLLFTYEEIDSNEMWDSVSDVPPVLPALKFLLRSRTFRERASTDRASLIIDTMNYVRGYVGKK